MFKQFLCKWIGHNWIFLPDGYQGKMTHATCERCLERRRLVWPDPEVAPYRPPSIPSMGTDKTANRYLK